MSTTRQDFEIRAGTAKTIYLTLTGLDFSNCALRWRAAGQIDSEEADVEKSTQAGTITVSDPVTGAVQFDILDTDIPESGLWYHAMEANQNAQGWEEVLRGRIVATPGMGAPAA